MSEMKADAWGREAEGVCIHQWWPLSVVTDYRSLMLPQRLPQLVEMNHPSAFFCKPSITSDSSPQTPAPPQPPPPTPPCVHLHRLTELHISRGCRKTSRSRWVMLTNQPQKTLPPAPPASPPRYILFLYQPSFSSPLFPSSFPFKSSRVSDSVPAFFFSPFPILLLLPPPTHPFLDLPVLQRP